MRTNGLGPAPSSNRGGEINTHYSVQQVANTTPQELTDMLNDYSMRLHDTECRLRHAERTCTAAQHAYIALKEELARSSEDCKQLRERHMAQQKQLESLEWAALSCHALSSKVTDSIQQLHTSLKARNGNSIAPPQEKR